MKKEFDFTGVPEQDVENLSKELEAKINYITSGRRDQYLKQQELQEKLKSWARAFAEKLKNNGGVNIHTCYTYWQYSFGEFRVFIPYTNDRQNTGFKSEEDFCASIRRYHHSGEIGTAKTIEELMKFVNDFKTNKVGNA